MTRRLRVVVTGRVQGVCFRMYTRDTAARLGLTGWVRNRPDGAVELVAEGPEFELGQLAEWCEHGPSHARVDRCVTTYSDATGGYTDFTITY